MDPFILIRQLQGALGGYSLRFGTGTISASASADTDYDVALVAWPREHVFFAAFVWPQTTWSGVDSVSSQVVDLDTGRVHYRNGATPQTLDVQWVSVGR